ncbi:PepSY domain-containing protein [Caenimonas sp. DR4.4]|uniref:PepSY domain-containing protein n=2 Tax=Caenimonas aquaedulcis TaxID=2793270 RepID=A0A931H4D5_9BURK|nr:PepSY domain-containing protein [Caenimonas aquaedulcis]
MNLLILPILLVLLLLTGPAWADVSRDDAAAVAQRMTNGRVLSVERSEAGRRVVWRVKVVTAQGEVRVILIDAATGRPL